MNIDLALAGALPDLQERERRLRAKAAAEGIVYEVADFGGLRTQADTTKILGYRDADYAAYVKAAKAAGKTPMSMQKFRPIQPFGNSYHNYGGALDAKIVKAPTGMTFEKALTRLGALAAGVGLVWGGLWLDPNTDRPHFQLPAGLPDVRARYAALHAPPAQIPLPAPLTALPMALPGVQLAAAKLGAVALGVPAAVRSVPVPTARAAVSVGALLVAGLLIFAAVKRSGLLED